MTSKGKILPLKYAVAITSIWEIIFFSYVAFNGKYLGAYKAFYYDYLEYPGVTIIWIIIVAVFGGILPFCLTDWFK